MTVSLGELNLGVVTGISFTDRKRLEDVNIPAMRGSSSQDLGELATDIELTGVFTGASIVRRFQTASTLQMPRQQLEARLRRD